MIDMNTGCFALIAFAFASSTVLAQTARIDVMHDDPDGVVLPGETIRVSALQSRSNQGGPATYFGHVSGDLTIAPNLGSSFGYTSMYLPTNGMWAVSPGSFVGASLTGFDVRFLLPPIGVVWVPPQWGNSSTELLSFQWTAPSVTQPTVVTFNWNANPAFPLVEVMYFDSLQPFPVPTTYTSTTILVLPTPAAWLAFAPVGAWAVRRRR